MPLATPEGLSLQTRKPQVNLWETVEEPAVMP